MALEREKNLSQLVNEAVRSYLSKIKAKGDNRQFFDYLGQVKKEINLEKNQLTQAIQKGRL